jgi:hypothetical protein
MQYSFPASWAGTGTVVTDLSAAAHNGVTDGTPALSTAVPTGAAAGTESLTTNSGGTQTTGLQLLSNATLQANNGFTYDAWFRWDGTSTKYPTQKILDYGGTESLQLFNPAGANQTAGEEVQFAFNGLTDAADAISMIVLPNVWYHATATFDSTGNIVNGTGGLAGLASLTINDGLISTSSSLSVTKSNSGDTNNRPLATGILSFSGLSLVWFDGQIYNPTVSLGVVPEPTSLALLSLAAPLLLRRRK